MLILNHCFIVFFPQSIVAYAIVQILNFKNVL